MCKVFLTTIVHSLRAVDVHVATYLFYTSLLNIALNMGCMAAVFIILFHDDFSDLFVFC